MSIVTNKTNFSGDKIFIFIEKDILISDKYCSNLLSEENLPDEEILNQCLKSNSIKDYYSETEFNYSAFMLKKDASIPNGCKRIPIRQFFWDTKNKAEQNEGKPSKLGNLAARAYGFLNLNEIYVYCPKCGTKMIADKKETAKECPNCGRKDFPHIEPAIIVLVKKGDEYLLVKNKNRAYNFFGCVSGFIEHGESVEECVAREVKEETNIDITNIKYVGSQAWPFPDQLMLAFTADYKDGEIKLQEDELEDGGWFNKNNLPTIPNPGSVAHNLIMGYFSSK